jgi:hypothetical protein
MHLTLAYRNAGAVGVLVALFFRFTHARSRAERSGHYFGDAEIVGLFSHLLCNLKAQFDND